MQESEAFGACWQDPPKQMDGGLVKDVARHGQILVHALHLLIGDCPVTCADEVEATGKEAQASELTSTVPELNQQAEHKTEHNSRCSAEKCRRWHRSY